MNESQHDSFYDKINDYSRELLIIFIVLIGMFLSFCMSYLKYLFLICKEYFKKRTEVVHHNEDNNNDIEMDIL